MHCYVVSCATHQVYYVVILPVVLYLFFVMEENCFVGTAAILTTYHFQPQRSYKKILTRVYAYTVLLVSNSPISITLVSTFTHDFNGEKQKDETSTRRFNSPYLPHALVFHCSRRTSNFSTIPRSLSTI